MSRRRAAIGRNVEIIRIFTYGPCDRARLAASVASITVTALFDAAIGLAPASMADFAVPDGPTSRAISIFFKAGTTRPSLGTGRPGKTPVAHR